jgi:TRAP-type C4-dicarboxylate transport system permease small subunit
MFFLDSMNSFLNRILIRIAGCIMIGMILLTCANIFLRLVWAPIRGTFELMGYLGATVTAFALGYTQIRRGHIAVDLLVQRFSKSTRRILNSLNHFTCMIFFGLAAWQITRYATTLRETGEVTETLRIIYYPFTYCVALGCAILSLVFLADFFKSIFQQSEDAA